MSIIKGMDEITDLEKARDEAVRIMMHILFFHFLRYKGFEFQPPAWTDPDGYELSAYVRQTYDRINALGAGLTIPDTHITNRHLQDATNLIRADNDYSPRHIGEIFESTIDLALYSKEKVQNV